MKTDLFDYSLPAELIAQTPAERRDASRLLVVERNSRRIHHTQFGELGQFLLPGDFLFRNNAAVIPARLQAARPTGGRVECLLLRPAENSVALAAPRRSSQHPPYPPSISSSWWCLVRPGRKLATGATFGIPGVFSAVVREKRPEGLARVEFETSGADVLAIAERVGEMPLPPYIGERHTDAERLRDRERYQTVYANRNRPVAAAAPTAGLHFTPELLGELMARGIGVRDLTLHVGLGTFRPISTDNIEDHAIHRELYEVPLATQQSLFNPTGRRIAIGTTSVRTLEDFASKHSAPAGADCFDEAALFIYPPCRFAAVDALITNFHQPRSTLLCLVAAFLAPGSVEGIAWLHEIYAEAISLRYRFFSYGDAMLIL